MISIRQGLQPDHGAQSGFEVQWEAGGVWSWLVTKRGGNQTPTTLCLSPRSFLPVLPPSAKIENCCLKWGCEEIARGGLPYLINFSPVRNKTLSRGLLWSGGLPLFTRTEAFPSCFSRFSSSRSKRSRRTRKQKPPSRKIRCYRGCCCYRETEGGGWTQPHPARRTSARKNPARADR